MFLVCWLFQTDVETKTNKVTLFSEWLLLLIVQEQIHILSNTWNLPKKLCKKIKSLQAS